MSTRANYRINGVLLYKHHDGYPEGAANFFNNMILEGGDITPENFIKQNPESRIAFEEAGDIEYFYEIKNENIRAYSIDWNTGKKILFFAGFVYEFINKYFEPWNTKDAAETRSLKKKNEYINIKGKFYSFFSALKNFDKKAEQLKDYANFDKENPNFKYSFEELEQAIEILQEFKGFSKYF